MMMFLRKHRNALMIVIAVLAIPFIFYFNKTDFSAQAANQLRLYDRTFPLRQLQRTAQLLTLSQELGLTRLGQTLTMGADRNNRNEVYNAFVINLIILRHEAERLGIRPTSAEIVDFVRNIRAFNGPNGFDQKKYDEFTQNALSPYGMTEAQIEEVVADELALNQVKDLVATGVSLPENEIKTEFDRAYGKVSVSVIRLHGADFGKDIKVSDEDVQKYYESHKAGLKTDEKRKVEFVSLALTEEQKKLSGKDRIDPLQKLSDRAQDFTQALLEKGADFHQVAAKFQLPVQSTGEFSRTAPDPKLKADPQLTTAAFQLTAQDPNSDIIQGQDGFYVLHLAGVTEARPLTLEEAKSKIVDAIKTTRSREMLSNQGAKIAHDLREGVKAGQAVPAALEKMNVKAEKLEPFTLADDFDPKDAANKKDKPKDLIAIKNAVASLKPGEVSEFFPWEDGGVVAYLEKQEPPDPSKYQEKKAAFESQILDNKRDVVFYEWLRERQGEAGLRAEKAEPGQPQPGRKS